MLKKSRFFVSATLISALLISTLILSNPVSVRACPAPPPDTLLSLFLTSDLIVSGEIKSAEDGKIRVDEKEYSYIEVIRNLRVSSVLKGKSKGDVAFTKGEYRSKTEPTSESESDDHLYFPYGYKGYSTLKVGEKYLFFFAKNAETQQYELTDETSGAKKLNDYELGIYKKRMRELKSIVKMEEDQLSALTDWLIRCLEEPATRWDGLLDLNNSFDALRYEERSEEEDKKPLLEEEDKKPLLIDGEYFETYDPEIARNMSDAQKAHISSILFRSIAQTSLETDEDEVSDSFIQLVRNWDKARLAIYAFSIFQNVDKTDTGKTQTTMSFISTILGDDKLYEIAEKYQAAEETEETEATVESKEETEKVDSSETVKSEPVEIAVEQTSENQIEVKETQAPQAETTEEAQPIPKKPTKAEIREKLLRDFISRYEHLLVRGFQVEEEKENAAVIDK